MTLREIFDNEFGISLSISSDGDKDLIFNKICLIFFSIVTPKYQYDGDVVLEVGKKIEADELGLDIGKFEIKRIFRHDVMTFSVIPTEYGTFKLSSTYHIDFSKLCALYINYYSNKSTEHLKSLGIEPTQINNTDIQIAEFEKELRGMYEIEENVAI